MRAVIYCRVSTGEQDPQNQLLVLRSWAEQQGHTTTGEYLDVACGARRREKLDDVFDGTRRRRSQRSGGRHACPTLPVVNNVFAEAKGRFHNCLTQSQFCWWLLGAHSAEQESGYPSICSTTVRSSLPMTQHLVPGRYQQVSPALPPGKSQQWVHLSPAVLASGLTCSRTS